MEKKAVLAWIWKKRNCTPVMGLFRSIQVLTLGVHFHSLISLDYFCEKWWEALIILVDKLKVRDVKWFSAGYSRAGPTLPWILSTILSTIP